MRKMFAIALISCAIPTSLFAQNIILHTNRNAVSKFYDRVNEIDCIAPVLTDVTLPAEIIAVKPGDKISFCADLTSEVNLTYTYAISVDSFSPAELKVSCSKGILPLLCIARIPDLIVTQLQSLRDHVITIHVYDEKKMELMPAQVSVRRPYCLTDQVTYEVDTPLPVAIAGALRNQLGSFTFETQVGKLRSQGWRIEWQRVQFRESNTALDGYWYMLGWCEGK